MQIANHLHYSYKDNKYKEYETMIKFMKCQLFFEEKFEVTFNNEKKHAHDNYGYKSKRLTII